MEKQQEYRVGYSWILPVSGELGGSIYLLASPDLPRVKGILPGTGLRVSGAVVVHCRSQFNTGLESIGQKSPHCLLTRLVTGDEDYSIDVRDTTAHLGDLSDHAARRARCYRNHAGALREALPGTGLSSDYVQPSAARCPDALLRHGSRSGM